MESTENLLCGYYKTTVLKRIQNVFYNFSNQLLLLRFCLKRNQDADLVHMRKAG